MAGGVANQSTVVPSDKHERETKERVPVLFQASDQRCLGVNRGYRVIVCVPERFSEEKVKIMRALGAEVIRTPDAEGMKGAIKKARELSAGIPGSFTALQFENPANPDFHQETTAQEIFDQMQGRIDAVVIGIGVTKLAIAAERGRSNVGFLVMLMVATLVVFVWLAKPPLRKAIWSTPFRSYRKRSCAFRPEWS